MTNEKKYNWITSTKITDQHIYFKLFFENLNPKNRNIECEENIIAINNLQVLNDNL